MIIFYIELPVRLPQYFSEEVRFYQKSWVSGDRILFDALKKCASLKFCVLIDDSKAFHRFGFKVKLNSKSLRINKFKKITGILHHGKLPVVFPNEPVFIEANAFFTIYRKTEIEKILGLVRSLDLVFFYLETPSLTKSDIKIIKVNISTPYNSLNNKNTILL